MEITLNIKQQGNNTNENFGVIQLSVSGKLANIKTPNGNVSVSFDELHRAIIALREPTPTSVFK